MKNKAEKDIYGNYTDKAIGYCHCKLHPGAVTKVIAQKHHCKSKQCHHLEKCDDVYWDTGKKRRKYNNRINKIWRKITNGIQ